MLSLLTSGIRQVSSVLFQFLSRTVFIYVLGKEYLGLNGLFTNILTLLSLSELGIGVAITYYLYEPLASNDKERIGSLMQFYKKCYNVVGIVILSVGCSLMPFIDKLVNFEQQLPENLYIVYLLFLFQSASTYFFFAYKQTLITADQKLYKIEKINIAYLILGCLVDVIVLLLFRSYLLYLVLKVILVILKNISISITVDKEYPFLKDIKAEKLHRDEIKRFFKDVYSVSIFKVGSVFFNSLSNLIISAMIGTTVVGVYSNYVLITSQIQAFFMAFVTAVTASVGNVLVQETKERKQEIFNKLRIYGFVISSLFTICFFQLSNSFMDIWLGNLDRSYIFSQAILFFISFDFYINTYCQIHNTFRQASGNFKIGRHLQLIGGIVNVALAIPLCMRFGLMGIFAAQVISKLVVTNIPFLYMVENRLFETRLKDTVLIIFRDIALTLFCGVAVWCLCRKIHQTSVLNFMIEMIVTLCFPLLFYSLFFWKSDAFVEFRQIAKNKILSKWK